jgi:hypothetical protein
MTTARIALLADRRVFSLGGRDAEKFLQGLITNDMALLAKGDALYAGLLTPQGKLLFEFFVLAADDGFWLETAQSQADGLRQRLAMYKLRAQVEIGEIKPLERVVAVWGASPGHVPQVPGARAYADPRVAALGWRCIAEPRLASQIVAATNGLAVPPADWHAHRIVLGVPEAGPDYVLGDTFPHEANFDQLHGISFTKGCFVGQEVVSRMQHRGGARKRVVPLAAAAALASGMEIRAGGAVIGKVGSVADRRALGLVRLDRAAEAAQKGEPLSAGGVEIVLRKPEWATFELTSAALGEAP